MGRRDGHRLNQNPTLENNFVSEFCQCSDEQPVGGPFRDYQRDIGIANGAILAACARTIQNRMVKPSFGRNSAEKGTYSAFRLWI